MIPFIQSVNDETTLQGWRSILEGNDLECFGAFAYVTDSGVAQVSRGIGDILHHSRNCRWVFGFDYGRSQPTALRRLSAMPRNEVRIFDGSYVVGSDGFTPRKIFHLKTALTLTDTGFPQKQIVGSGNLSASGLMTGVEAGCIIDYMTVGEGRQENIRDSLQQIWDSSTPLNNVIDDYENRYAQFSRPSVRSVREGAVGVRELFWIDVGYVTQNRGPNRAGNQFDLPRGSHMHFGLREQGNAELNSVLGELNISTPIGEVVSRNLRFGNNSMEKLTLPIPEQYGYGSYDGKILTFENTGEAIVLLTYEPEDFFRSYGQQITSVEQMQSGRCYGTASIPVQ